MVMSPVASRTKTKTLVVSIHQPEHLPWLGFFDKLRRSDVFVLLDNVQYRKNYFQNRNKIRTATGWQWLTVPVMRRSLGKPICEVMVDQHHDWRRASWTAIQQHYHRAPYWVRYAPFLEQLYAQAWERLVDLNCAIIQWMVAQLGLTTTLVRGSDLSSTGRASDLLLGQCQELGATTYLSGPFGRAYLDGQVFERAGIAVQFHEFRHPVHPQVYPSFEPSMSTVDLLLNMGPDSLSVIEEANR